MFTPFLIKNKFAGLAIASSIILLLGNATVAVAQQSISLGSVTDAVALALKSNPTYNVYQAQVRQAQQNYGAQLGTLLPQLSGSFSGTDNLHLAVTPIPGILIGQPGTTYYAQFGKAYTYNTGLTLSADVFNWQNILQTGIAKGNIALNQLQQNLFKQTLTEQVARAYFTALVAKASLAIANRDEALADTLKTLSQQRFAEGAADALAVNQSAINYNNIEQNKLQSQQLYNTADANLRVLLGVANGASLQLAQSMDVPISQSKVLTDDIALGADNNVAVARQQYQQATRQRKAQWAAGLPKLSATFYVGGQQYHDDFTVDLHPDAFSAYRYIGINLTVPLFTGLSNWHKYKSAQEGEYISKNKLDDTERQTAINDALLLQNQQDYTRMLRSAEANYNLYSQNLKLNAQKYAEGVIALDVYLKAFDDYLKAENNYLTLASQLFAVKATLISRQ